MCVWVLDDVFETIHVDGELVADHLFQTLNDTHVVFVLSYTNASSFVGHYYNVVLADKSGQRITISVSNPTRTFINPFTFWVHQMALLLPAPRLPGSCSAMPNRVNMAINKSHMIRIMCCTLIYVTVVYNIMIFIIYLDIHVCPNPVTHCFAIIVCREPMHY